MIEIWSRDIPCYPYNKNLIPHPSSFIDHVFFFFLGQNQQAGQAEASNVKLETYDKDYFSSGSDDENQVGGVPSKSKQRRKILTNEELFYDPEMDDIDEKWVNKQRENNAGQVTFSSLVTTLYNNSTQLKISGF